MEKEQELKKRAVLFIFTALLELISIIVQYMKQIRHRIRLPGVWWGSGNRRFSMQVNNCWPHYYWRCTHGT